MDGHIRTLFWIAVAIVWFFATARLSYSQTVTETDIMPTISLSPGIGEVGEAGLVSITIKNANPNCAEQLLHGDVWTLKFDLGDGQIRAIPSGVGVDSATMSPKDFEVAQSTDTWEVMIMYQGAPAAFGVEDAIAIRPTLQAPSTHRHGCAKTLQLKPGPEMPRGVLGRPGLW